VSFDIPDVRRTWENESYKPYLGTKPQRTVGEQDKAETTSMN